LREGVWDIPLPEAQEKVAYGSAQLVRHVSLTSGSVWVEAMEIKMASIWRILVLGNVEDLKEQSYTGGLSP
jgi:hypothetical protein